MRVLFRADSSATQGTGHVMRCLTLAEELLRRGHEVHLMTAPITVPWLRSTVSRSNILVHGATQHSLDHAQVEALQPDWLVVDSYEIPAVEVSRANLKTRVMALVDGDDRGIEAALYVDQNLGAEGRIGEDDHQRLYGAQFALVRHSVVAARRSDPWRIGEVARVLCFMGGTDPTGSVVGVASAISRVEQQLVLTVVAPVHSHDEVRAALAGYENLVLLAPTPSLPGLIAEASVVVSAAGTSAWDICTLGVPAVLVAVVKNQVASLRASVAHGVALGAEPLGAAGRSMDQITGLVEQLLDDESLRRDLSHRSVNTFDGQGAARVASRMESVHTRHLGLSSTNPSQRQK